MCFSNLKKIGLVFLSLSISGCQYVPEKWGIEESLSYFTSESEATVEPEVIHSDFSPEINKFLTSAQNGNSHLFESSPWGENALITVDKLYFSASGRTCRSITITLEKNTNNDVVCQAAVEQWVTIRPVTKVNQLK